MYFKYLATSTVLQNPFIPSISWSLVVSLASLRMDSLSSCQMFSIGLRSGDSAGVFHQLLMELFFIQSAAYPDVFQVILHKSMLFGKNIGDEWYKGALKDAHKQLLLHNPLKNAHPSPSFLQYTGPHMHLSWELALERIYNHVYYWVHKKLLFA